MSMTMLVTPSMLEETLEHSTFVDNSVAVSPNGKNRRGAGERPQCLHSLPPPWINNRAGQGLRTRTRMRRGGFRDAHHFVLLHGYIFVIFLLLLLLFNLLFLVDFDFARGAEVISLISEGRRFADGQGYRVDVTGAV